MSQFIPRCLSSSIYVLFVSLGRESEIALVLVQNNLSHIYHQAHQLSEFFQEPTDRQTDRRIEAPCQSLKIYIISKFPGDFFLFTANVWSR